MTRKSIQIVDGFRDSYNNEFFFRSDPTKTAGIQELLRWVEQNTNLIITHIPTWQIKSKTQGEIISYGYGVRIEKVYK
tara:strand:- start:2899 stop:3132 length:234 start_codon:yes stop_codon:yes gene_type:complete